VIFCLIKLEIIDNKLTPACLPQILQLKQLQSLSLGGNQFNTFDEIKPLAALDNLIDLDLFGCKICEDSKYRPKIYEIFPNLMVLLLFLKFIIFLFILFLIRYWIIVIKKEKK